MSQETNKNTFNYHKMAKNKLHLTTLEHVMRKYNTRSDPNFYFKNNAIRVKKPGDINPKSVTKVLQILDKTINQGKWNQTQTFELVLNGIQASNKETLSTVIRKFDALSFSKKLQQFKFNCNSCYVEEGQTQLFTFHIPRAFPKLHFLVADFGCQNLTGEKPMKNTVKGLGRNLKYLQQLAVNLNYRDVAIPFLPSNSNSNLTLPKLNIYIGYDNKTADSMVGGVLTKIGRDLTRTDSLIVNLTECHDLSDQGIRNLTKIVSQKIKNLKHLKLVFSGCVKITNSGVEAIVKSVSSSLENLDSLSFDFSCCHEITQQGVQILAKEISQNLVNLKHLSVNLKGCYEIGNRGVETFGKEIGAVKKLTKLESLVISFGCDYSVDDRALEKFGTNIGTNIPNLKKLNIGFLGAYAMTDKAVQTLTKEISEKLTNLQDISLTFTKCHQITDKGVESSSKELSTNLPLLNSLTLNFAECAYVTTVGIELAAKEIGQKLPRFQKLSVSFGSAFKISDQELDSLFNKIVSHLRMLEHLRLNSRTFC